MDQFISNETLIHYLVDESDPDDEIMQKFFVPIKKIGQGAFATVLSAFDRLSQTRVAIKIIDKTQFKQAQLEMLKRESNILNKLNHPNIVRMKMSKETLSKVFIVMDYVDGISLQEYIKIRNKKNQALEQSEIKQITIQIARAIKYFHEKDIIHRDLKPENIIISISDDQIHENNNYREQENTFTHLNIKIIDFGLSIQLENQRLQTQHDKCGTLYYMAPEVALNREYNRQVDIWSFGIVVFMMFSMGEHPFWTDDDNKLSYLEKLKNPEWKQWPTNMDRYQLIINSPQIKIQNRTVINFISKTVSKKTEFRMTAEQCLKHPWLNGYGDIGEPITMGDMITTFSNMQNFISLIKGVSYLISLKQFMLINCEDALLKTQQKYNGSKISSPTSQYSQLNQSYLRDSIIEASVDLDQKNYKIDKKQKNSLYTDGDSCGSNNSNIRTKKKDFKIQTGFVFEKKINKTNSAEKLLSNRRLIYSKYTQKNNIKKTCSFGQLANVQQNQEDNQYLNIDSHKQTTDDQENNFYIVDRSQQFFNASNRQFIEKDSPKYQPMMQSTLFQSEIKKDPIQKTQSNIQTKFISLQSDNNKQQIKISLPQQFIYTQYNLKTLQQNSVQAPINQAIIRQQIDQNSQCQLLNKQHPLKLLLKKIQSKMIQVHLLYKKEKNPFK